MGKKRCGFTLIELLIVVAIIAILAAIAVPNFLEAQIRSKVTRTKADMRTIVVAMEAYFVDWNGYPRHRDFTYPNPPISQQDPWWRPLTTPVAYMTLLPRDPFAIATRLAIAPWPGGFIHYDPINNTWDVMMGNTWGPYDGFVPEFRARGFWYVLYSVGPDGDHDFAGTAGEGYGRHPSGLKQHGMSAFYDPTNGTVSSGDLIRLGPGGSDQIVF